MHAAVDKYNLIVKKAMRGVIFSFSNSDTNQETRTPTYVIEEDHKSVVETALSVRTKISRGWMCDFDLLIVKPIMFPNCNHS